MRNTVKLRVERNKYTNPEAPKYLGRAEFITHISGKTYTHEALLAHGDSRSQVLQSAQNTLDAQLNQIGTIPYRVIQ